MAETTDLFVAKARFHYYPSPGVPVLILEHSVARAGHPVIAAAPDMWRPLTVDYEVEKTATTKSYGGRKGPGA